MSRADPAAAPDRAGLLEEWMRLYGTRVLHLAYTYLRDRHAAEDVAQEVFIRAYRAMDEFRGQSAVYTWLYRITVNLCRDRLRSAEARRVTLPGELPTAAGSEDPEGQALDNLRSQALARLVLALPEPYREVVVLYYYHELSTAEIAQVTGQAENTVKTRLHRARQQLREMLAREGVAP